MKLEIIDKNNTSTIVEIPDDCIIRNLSNKRVVFNRRDEVKSVEILPNESLIIF